MPSLITFGELKERGVPYTRRHLLTLEAERKFPKRVQLGGNRVAWVEEEIEDWVKKKIEARE